MTHKEIELLVEKAKKGDDKSVVLILDEFRPFIFKVGRRYNIKGCDIYDLVQTCYVALIGAIEKYRLGSHTFKSYAYATITNALKYLARSCKKHQNVQSLNDKISSDCKTEYIEILESDENIECVFLKNSDMSVLREILSTLTAEDFELIFIVYYNNVSLKNYAEKKGISYLVAVRKKEKILEYIKSEYIKKDKAII